ncbi:MAG: OmpA family protein [bacterium]|nr:OmpA family protein [bacterium]
MNAGEAPPPAGAAAASSRRSRRVAVAVPAAAAPAADAPAPDVTIAAAADALTALAGGSEAMAVTRGDADVVLTLGEAVSFAPGGTDLAPGAEPILAGLRRIAEAMGDLRIEVVGHTDDRPIRSPRYPSNLELSLARAARVAHELAAGDAALGARIVASGRGPYWPVASNDDASGRARNRRVEIRLRPAS